MITGNDHLDGSNFYLVLTPDERHALLKLTVNEPGLFRKINKASINCFPVIPSVGKGIGIGADNMKVRDAQPLAAQGGAFTSGDWFNSFTRNHEYIEANNCARAITALVEKTIGKSLPLEACMKIAACAQMAIDTESAKLANDSLTWQYWRDRARAAEAKEESADWCLANGWELQSPAPIDMTPGSFTN